MGVIDTIKEVGDIVKKAGDIDLYRKIVHAEGEIIELTRQLRAAENRILGLEETLKFKDKLSFKTPFYYAEGDSVPFCPKCWEADKKAVHMIIALRTNSTIGQVCPQCPTKITTDLDGNPGHGVKGWNAL
jgi:hypothetical protein